MQHLLPSSAKSAMHRISATEVAEKLSSVEMIALSMLFEDWALNEPDIDDEERTRLILWSVDYERLAEICGPQWRPTNPGWKADALQFLAREEMQTWVLEEAAD